MHNWTQEYIHVVGFHSEMGTESKQGQITHTVKPYQNKGHYEIDCNRIINVAAEQFNKNEKNK